MTIVVLKLMINNGNLAIRAGLKNKITGRSIAYIYK